MKLDSSKFETNGHYNSNKLNSSHLKNDEKIIIKSRINRNTTNRVSHPTSIKLSNTSSTSSGIGSLTSSNNSSPTSPISSFIAKRFFEDIAIKNINLHNKDIDGLAYDCVSIPYVLRSLSVDEVDLKSHEQFENFRNYKRNLSQIERKQSSIRIHYSPSFMIELRKSPLCLHRPNNLPDLPIVLHHSVISLSSNSMPELCENIAISSRGKSISIKNGKSSSTPSRQQSITSDSARRVICLNLNAEVRLHEAENAWKAASINKYLESSCEEELVKKLTSVLNKLSNANFDVLMLRVDKLDMQTEENMKICINVIFDKAVTECNFSELYAKLTKYQAKRNAITLKHSYVNFQDLMITRCQCEYEMITYDRQLSNASNNDITSPEYLLKKRALGTIRFIGELYKQDLLQERVLHKCIWDLLKSVEDEDNLESLCRLMTCIGHKLDHSKSIDLMKQYFNRINNILEKKTLSSRMRFMLLDLIDLKKSNWMPRNCKIPINVSDSNQSVKASTDLVFNSKFEKSTNIRNNLQPLDRYNNNYNCSPDLQIGKVRPLLLNFDKSPINISSFNSARNSKNGYNSYKSLKSQNISSRKFGQNESSKQNINFISNQLYNSNEIYSLITNESNNTTVVGSSLASHCNSSSNLSSTSLTENNICDSGNCEMIKNINSISSINSCSLKVFEKKCLTLFEEYLNSLEFDIDLLDEYKQHDNEIKFTEFLVLFTFEKNLKERRILGCLMHQCISKNIIAEDAFLTGLSNALDCVDDIVIDIPRVWDYIGDILVAILINDPPKYAALLITKGIKAFDKNIIQKLLDVTIKSIIQHDGLSMAVSFCIKANLKNGYVTNPDVNAGIRELDLDREKSNILSEMDSIIEKNYNIYDNLVNIYEKYCVQFSDESFIRELASRFLNSLVKVDKDMKHKVDEVELIKTCDVLKKFVQSYTKLELQVLYAAQVLVNQLNHPFGLLRIFFDAFYDEDVVTDESFDLWYDNDEAEMLGKGVARQSVTQFFKWLHEDEESDEEE